MSFNKIIFQRDPDVADAPATEVKDWTYQDNSIEELVDINQVANDEPVEVATEVTAPEVAEVIAPEIVPAITPVTEAAPVEIKPVDWRAAIKTADKYEALKELGYDDFTIEMIKYKDTVGDLTPYLEVKTVDYTAMTPEQILKLDLKKQNPGMSERALDFKFRKEFEQKYYTNRDDYPEDSDEAIYGDEQLRLDADSKKQQFIQDQAKFKAPEPKADLDASRKAEELQAKQTQRKNFVLDSPITKALQTSKAFTFGEGEASFTYPIADVQPIIDNALNTVVNATESDITPESYTRFVKSLIIAQDPDAFYAAAFKNGQKGGIKKVVDEIQNVTPLNNNTTAPAEENLTPAQQLARMGRYT